LTPRLLKYSVDHSHPANLSTICRMPLTISLYSRKTPDAKIVKEPAIIVNFPFSAVFPVGLRKYGGGQLANLPMPPTRGARFGSLSRSAACTGCGLPAAHDHIDIGRADLETAADAAGHFGRDQARARTEKRVIDQLAGPAIVDNRAAHALDRLLRGVPPALFALSIAKRIVVGDLPHGGLLAATLPVAWLALAPRIPAGFMAPMVVAPTQGEMRFGPDDLSAQLFKGDIELLRTESEMRVLVAGAGAIGGYFGGRLLEAGRVPFGVRAGWHLPAPGANRNRKFVDSLLEGDGFELSVPRERGYRPGLSSVIYVPETVRVLPNKYMVATALAALVELHQNGKRSPCHRAAVIR